MKEIKYVIKDKLGMHARPTGMFAKKCASFESKVTLRKDDKEVDAKRVFAVMGLCVKNAEEITLVIEGPDEEQASTELSRFLEENL